MRYISNLNNKTVKEICKIFDKSTRTVYRWFDRFKEEQTDKLADEVGRGRKAALNETDIENVKKLIKMHSVKETCIILNKEPNRVKKVSPQILKRYLKKYKV
jgi:transposase